MARIRSVPLDFKPAKPHQQVNPSTITKKSTLFIFLNPLLSFFFPFSTSSTARYLHISPSWLFFRPLCRKIALFVAPFQNPFLQLKGKDRSHTTPRWTTFNNWRQARCLESSLLEAPIEPPHRVNTSNTARRLQIPPSSCCWILH